MSIDIDKVYFAMGHTIAHIQKKGFDEKQPDFIRGAGETLQKQDRDMAEQNGKGLDESQQLLQLVELLQDRFPNEDPGDLVESLTNSVNYYESVKNLRGLGLATSYDPRKSVRFFLNSLGAQQLVFDERNVDLSAAATDAKGLNIDRNINIISDPGDLVQHRGDTAMQPLPADAPIEVSPYLIGVNAVARRQNLSPQAVRERRTKRDSQRLNRLEGTRKKVAELTAARKTNQKAKTAQTAGVSSPRQPRQSVNGKVRQAQPQAESDPATLQKNQQYAANREYEAARKARIQKLSGFEQVKATIEPYVSNADINAIRKGVNPNTKFEPAQMDALANLLKHLNDIGAEFDLQADASQLNRITAVVNGDRRVKLRVLDNVENSNNIGQVYTDEGVFFYEREKGANQGPKNSQLNNLHFGALDYALGRDAGRARFGKKEVQDFYTHDKSYLPRSTHIYVRGDQPEMQPGRNNQTNGKVIERPYVIFYPAKGSQRLPKQLNATQADAFLNNQIRLLRPEYLKIVLGPDLTNIDASAAADQQVVAAAKEEYGATDEDAQVAADYLKTYDSSLNEASEQLSPGAKALIPVLSKITDDYIGVPQTGPNTGRINFDNIRMLGNQEGSTSNLYSQLINAYKASSWTPQQIIGTEYGVKQVQNRLVSFSPESAKKHMLELSPAEKQVLGHVERELSHLGLDLTSDGAGVEIDANGIIQWKGKRELGLGKEKIPQMVQGEIGQVFLPDKDGVIHTNYASGDNFDFVPGIKGYYSTDGLATGTNRMQRLRGEGFTQILNARLDQAVRVQLLRYENDDLSSPTDSSMLNVIYSKETYGKRLAPNWQNESKLSPETRRAIINTLRHRVRFSNKLGQAAGSFSESRKGDNQDPVSKLVDGQNIRILADDYKGVFDMTMTGTNKTQGEVLYMGNGAKLNADGTFSPATDEKGQVREVKAPIREMPEFKYDSYNAWDRNQMASNQILTGLHVAHHTRAMLATFGGWTFDDSAVVSKEFAERNMVESAHPGRAEMKIMSAQIQLFNNHPDQFDAEHSPWSNAVMEQGVDVFKRYSIARRTNSDQKQAIAAELNSFVKQYAVYRPLTVGDKISDFGGNKATIGLVVDRHMDADNAAAQGLTNEVDIFAQNRDLDLVMAPYSVVTRDNTGVVRELMDESTGKVKPVQFVDQMGQKHDVGYSGTLNTIVTDLTVDSKTHAYTDEDVRMGRSRKASGQLNWAAVQMGADGVIDELWGHNQGPYAAFREYLTVAGYDMAADGTLQVGFYPHEDEHRQVFEVNPEVQSSEFVRQLGTQGGLLKLPFALDTHVPVAPGSKDTIKTQEIPILSASLRRNQELMNGTMKMSDYTNYYENIYNNTVKYLKAAAKENPNNLENKQQSVQRMYDALQQSVIDDQLGGRNGQKTKFSHIRTKMMTKRLAHSATAVQTADPRLPIDTISISPAINKSLNRKDGQYVMMWRDPCLRGEAISGMRAQVDNSLIGMSVNPIGAAKYDGDFDGDSIGLTVPETAAAQADLRSKLYLGNNTMDAGSGDKSTVLNVGMDLVSSALATGLVKPVADDPNEHTPKQQLQDMFVEFHRTSSSPQEEVDKINRLLQSTLRVPEAFGSAGIDLRSPEKVIESVKTIVNSSAKGGPKAIDEFQQYFNDEKGTEAAQEIQRASGYKSDLTGVAGAYSQRIFALLRDHDPKAALEVTYPNTQGVLQVKHSPEQAIVIHGALMDDMRNLFNGVSVGDTANAEPGTLTRGSFIQELTDVYTDKLGIDVDPKYINALADALTDENGIIVPLDERQKQLASPMDQLAYGYGLSTIDSLARDGRSIAEGKNSSKVVPMEIRGYSTGKFEDVVVKEDVQAKEEPLAPANEQVKQPGENSQAEPTAKQPALNAPHSNNPQEARVFAAINAATAAAPSLEEETAPELDYEAEDYGPEY